MGVWSHKQNLELGRTIDVDLEEVVCDITVFTFTPIQIVAFTEEKIKNQSALRLLKKGVCQTPQLNLKGLTEKKKKKEIRALYFPQASLWQEMNNKRLKRQNKLFKYVHFSSCMGMRRGLLRGHPFQEAVP